MYEATRRDRWLAHSQHRLHQHQPPANEQVGDAPPGPGTTGQSAEPLTPLRTSVSDRYVEDLTNGIRRGSIVLDPPYQRGPVWTTDQRVALIRSWLIGVPVGFITLNNRMGPAWHRSDPHARIALAIPTSWLPTALIATTHDTSDGPYVRASTLTQAGRRRVHSQMTLPCVQAHLPDVESEAGLYLLINNTGTPQSLTDLRNAAHVAGR